MTPSLVGLQFCKDDRRNEQSTIRLEKTDRDNTAGNVNILKISLMSFYFGLTLSKQIIVDPQE